MHAAPSDAPLAFRVYQDALLAPSASRSVYRGIDGAVFDAEGRPVRASLLTRSWDPPEISHPPDLSGVDLDAVDVVEEPHVYGGYFFDHYGHFLLESLARAWVVDEVGRLPFAWASGGPPRPWQAEILSLLDLDVPHRFPSRPTRFRRLVVAEPGYRIQTFFHPRHARFLGRWDGAGDQEGGPRVWLSRTELAAYRQRSPGEARLQRVLRRRGWQVVHPQRLDVEEQLRILARAAVVAGIEGSAFHTAVLMRRPTAPLIVLRRGPSPNYRTIADRRGIVEFDLYGARRVEHDLDQSLTRPGRWARLVDGLADRIAQLTHDPDALEALRAEVEARHDLEGWRRSQARRPWRRLVPLAKGVVRDVVNPLRAVLRGR